MNDQPGTKGPFPDGREISQTMADIAESSQKLVADFLARQAGGAPGPLNSGDSGHGLGAFPVIFLFLGFIAGEKIDRAFVPGRRIDGVRHPRTGAEGQDAEQHTGRQRRFNRLE